ncbi:hypothetical protein DRE_04396 [Drechslerella stenobrocha 248]|uniref:Peptidase M14 domain-containing protein n=1 Tax=Drechslerella stenobrocha 248 TaxID=1043628 RepID=W7I2A0_9PEZI|nr:hypothetical protein DRE_04396 [Drechslerella stenobrocha 248]
MKLLAVLSLLAPLASAAAVSSNTPITYDGYHVFRIDTHGRGDAIERKLQGLKAVQYNFDTEKHIEIAVAPEDVYKFHKLNLDAALVDMDLGASIRAEGGFFPDADMTVASSLSSLRSDGRIPSIQWFDSYHTFPEHQQWLVDVQGAFSRNSELFEVGKSHEGNPINGIHLWGRNGKGSRPAVYWHGTVHAREWISTMVVEYLTWKLVTGYSGDSTVKSILDKYDFYILPVVNPDGFIYSQKTDRLWRKNRLPGGSGCFGTDMNRNWPYKWEVPGGSSTSPCAETYRGTGPGSTVEIDALVKFSQELAGDKGIKLYVDWHSFSQLILLPYGYDCKARVPNYEQQMSLARGVANAIKGYGSRRSTFTPGETCPALYKAVGGSTDYMQDVANAEISWCIELHPTNSGFGAGGFVLTPDKIKPSAEEIWAGMLYLLPTM